MSNSQNKKNEQQNNLCTTLTEQWKKSELEQGYYYTKYNPKVGKPFVEIELRNYLLDLAKVRDAETVEVLAPVPSYQEYMSLVFYKEDLTKACKMRDKIIKKYEDIDDWWKVENQQLKGLLRECKHIMNIEKDFASCHFEKHKLNELLTKIDEVLK